MVRAAASARSRSIVMSSATMGNACGKYRTPMNAEAIETTPRRIQNAGRFISTIYDLRFAIYASPCYRLPDALPRVLVLEHQVGVDRLALPPVPVRAKLGDREMQVWGVGWGVAARSDVPDHVSAGDALAVCEAV